MGFDIGLKKVNQLISISAQRSQRKYVELHWACDMVVVWNIGDVAPVLDENMMRIYADVYRRDITNLNDEQLKELATSYQQAIKVFCFLAITSPDVFLGLIGAHQSWLTYILDATQTSDDHLALSCIECLVSLCRFAESKGDASFRPFIECLLENECFTDEVNARTASENSTLAAAAEALVDYLNR